MRFRLTPAWASLRVTCPSVPGRSATSTTKTSRSPCTLAPAPSIALRALAASSTRKCATPRPETGNPQIPSILTPALPSASLASARVPGRSSRLTDRSLSVLVAILIPSRCECLWRSLWGLLGFVRGPPDRRRIQHHLRLAGAVGDQGCQPGGCARGADRHPGRLCGPGAIAGDSGVRLPSSTGCRGLDPNHLRRPRRLFRAQELGRLGDRAPPL